jgi:hypothetical protein
MELFWGLSLGHIATFRYSNSVWALRWRFFEELAKMTVVVVDGRDSEAARVPPGRRGDDLNPISVGEGAARSRV